MNKLLYTIVLLASILSSCAYLPRTSDYGYPNVGVYNNASIPVKDYETLGLIFVKSSEVIDGDGNHEGSKITYEMIMLEAQKLGADDVINIRVDIKQKVDYSKDRKPIRTTYEYTANALAIKYTTALVIDNRGVVSQDIGNRNSVLDKMAKPKPPSYYEPASNWLSMGQFGMGGVGIRYEYKIFPYFSLGGDGYFTAFGFGTNGSGYLMGFGADVTARYYPLGKAFYIGTSLGLNGHSYSNYFDENGKKYSNYDDIPASIRDNDKYKREHGTLLGFAITPELGCKIYFGRQRGFIADIGIKVPQIFTDKGYHFNVVPYLGFGAAF